MGESFQKTAVNLESIAPVGTSKRFLVTGNVREHWENQINGIDSVCSFQAEELELSVAADGILKHAHQSTIDEFKSCTEFDE
jgi:hypothetical protein